MPCARCGVTGMRHMMRHPHRRLCRGGRQASCRGCLAAVAREAFSEQGVSRDRGPWSVHDCVCVAAPAPRRAATRPGHPPAARGSKRSLLFLRLSRSINFLRTIWRRHGRRLCRLAKGCPFLLKLLHLIVHGQCTHLQLLCQPHQQGLIILSQRLLARG